MASPLISNANALASKSCSNAFNERIKSIVSALDSKFGDARSRLYDPLVEVGPYNTELGLQTEAINKNLCAKFDKSSDGSTIPGVAFTVHHIDLYKHASPCPPSVKEIEKVRSSCFDAWTSLEKGHARMNFDRAVDVAIFSKESLPSPHGQFRMLLADVLVFAAADEWRFWLEFKEGDSFRGTIVDAGKLKQLRQICHATCHHIPMNLKYVAESPSLEQELLALNFQGSQDIHMSAEAYTHSAWDTMSAYAKIRDLNAAATGNADNVEKVEEFFTTRISYSRGSALDPSLKSNKKDKIFQVSLTSHDKIKSAGLDWILSDAKADFPMNFVLNNLTKLNVLCQRCGKDTERLRFVFQMVWVRAKRQVIKPDMPRSEVVKFVDNTSMFYDITAGIITHILPDVHGQAERKTFTNLRELILFNDTFGHPDYQDQIMALSKSCQYTLEFQNDCINAEYDAVFAEMQHNCKDATLLVKLGYAKLPYMHQVKSFMEKEANARAIATPAPADAAPQSSPVTEPSDGDGGVGAAKTSESVESTLAFKPQEADDEMEMTPDEEKAAKEAAISEYNACVDQ